jgi:ferrous iron transport protein B
MGLTPGTEVTVKRTAPFGDPMEITLRGYELSLRREDAAQIVIGGKPHTGRIKPSLISYAAGRLDSETLRRIRAAARCQNKSAHEPGGPFDPDDRELRDGRLMRVALVGNPNSGKTTLFNALTGANQYVGNWPGVTVEKKEGVAGLGNSEISIVDLPGIYSLSPYSIEEIVTRDCILGRNEEEAPDAVINIVDATNIERNMYLTVQLLELERPMVMALSFMDEARSKGDEIDIGRLSRLIGIPVVPICAKTGENLQALLQTAAGQARTGLASQPDGLYDELTYTYSAYGDNETMIADRRYRFIEHVVKTAVKKGERRDAETLTDRIDRIATHRILAVPVFLVMMLLMFVMTFGPVGSFLSDGIAFLIGNLTGWVSSVLSAIGTAGWLTGLVTEGIIAGVGGVLKYLPQIALLFFFLSLLEDSGYMARAAFIMDRLLRHFGLSGKAFIPLLMGFGCSVPAVLGARAMENEKDRRMTIMLIPFMSCSAKLPVYGLIAAAFFGAWAGLVIFLLYILGMSMAVVSGLIFKRTIFTGDPAPFVLELPPYRMPSASNMLTHVWERIRGFLIKAGTLILVMSIVLWFLQNFSIRFQMVTDSADSMLCAVGTAIAPFFRPMGFGMWQAVVALLTGLIAKEAVVASLSMFYGFSASAGGLAVAAAMTGFTPLSAFSYLVFILLYIPCLAAVATIFREMNSLKYTAVSAGWQLGTAYLMSLLAYQIGRFVGL